LVMGLYERREPPRRLGAIVADGKV